MYKVSVIVPVYNAEKFLNRCVDSLINQTLKDIEIILVDDGSKDSSPAICDEYAEEYENINVLHLENGGPARARNKGIEIATGEYIGFVDADDDVKNNMYSVLYENAKKNNADISMCSYSIIENGKEEIVRLYLPDVCNSNEEIKDKILSKFYGTYVTGLNSLCIKIFRTALLKENGIVMNEALIRAEDMWYNFDVFKVANSFCCVNESLYNYYQNENSIMHNEKNDSYDHWVNNRKRLLIENKQLGIEIDYNLFYKDFLYKTIVFCRNKVKLNQNEIVKSVFGNEFFKATVKYNAYLPKHIKLISFFIKMNLNGLAMLLLKIW